MTLEEGRAWLESHGFERGGDYYTAPDGQIAVCHTGRDPKPWCATDEACNGAGYGADPETAIRGLRDDLIGQIDELEDAAAACDAVR